MPTEEWLKQHRLVNVFLSDGWRRRLNSVLSDYGYSFSAWVRAMIARCESDRIESQGGLKKVIPPELPEEAAGLLFDEAFRLRGRIEKELTGDDQYEERRRLRERAEYLDDLGALCKEWVDAKQARDHLADKGDRRTRRTRRKGDADAAS